MLTIITFLLTLYIFLSASHFVLQLIFAELYHRKQAKTQEFTQKDNQNKTVIIYPIYNEDPEVLKKVMNSAHEAVKDLPNVSCIFVDDGSPNLAQVLPIYTKFKNNSTGRIGFIIQKNAGKREAQATGILANPESDYYITVDSDTIINKEAIQKAIAFMQSNSEVGAATGDVRVENADQNLLTKLISLRYWLAFNTERAAQSYFGSMLCCSGPFTIYKGGLLRKLLPKYTNQFFFGQKCTYGDDRHLTNLVLSEGQKTVYLPFVQAYTFVPSTIKEYITQQTRWNKSFYREFFWTLQISNKVSFYSLIDIVLQPILYFLFLVAISHLIFRIAIDTGWTAALYYISILLFVAFLRSLYGIYKTGNWEFLKFVLYGFVHILVLVSVRFKALLTLGDNGWGTRGKKKNVWLDFTAYSMILTAVLVWLAVSFKFF